jgi:hypothetical protein
MSQPIMTAPLAGCVTIDSKSPDGYLGNARAGNPTAGSNDRTQTAVESLLAMAGAAPTTASLVGHGSEGDIDTGMALGQSINLANQATWAPLLQRLRGKFTGIYLYGATVGGGFDGAQLLYAIAQATDTPVYGPTGILYCDVRGNFVLETGAVWQMATPDRLPTPINPPTLSGSSSRGGARTQAGQAMDVTAAQTQATQTAQRAWDPPLQPLGEPGGKVTAV